MVVLLNVSLSNLPERLEFPIETTGEVSVACMLSFSYEDSINVYSFIVRVIDFFIYQRARTYISAFILYWYYSN